MEVTAANDDREPDAASRAFRAAAAAAAFGMALRDDPLRGAADFDLAGRLLEHDPAPVAANPARAALLDLARGAKAPPRPASQAPRSDKPDAQR